MEKISLEPVDSLTITTLIDNLIDIFMPEQGPARRFGPATSQSLHRLPAAFLEGGQVVDLLRAEHGFSALLTVTKQGREHNVLFDAGVTPDGLAHNVSALDIDPGGIEAIVLSHGHFDHTTGLDGFARLVGRPNLPASSTRSSGTGGGSASPGGNRGSCRPPPRRRWKASDSTSSKAASPPFCSTDRCSSPARSTAPPTSSRASLPRRRTATATGSPTRSSSTTRA